GAAQKIRAPCQDQAKHVAKIVAASARSAIELAGSPETICGTTRARLSAVAILKAAEVGHAVRVIVMVVVIVSKWHAPSYAPGRRCYTIPSTTSASVDTPRWSPTLTRSDRVLESLPRRRTVHGLEHLGRWTIRPAPKKE